MIPSAAIGGVLLGVTAILVGRRKLWIVYVLMWAVFAAIAVWVFINLDTSGLTTIFVSFAVPVGLSGAATEYLLRWRDSRGDRSLVVDAGQDTHQVTFT